MTSTTGLIGYCQPLKIHGDETTALKVSSNGPGTCSVSALRIVCGDIDPDGPGAEFEKMDWGGASGLHVRHQPVNAGSFAFAAAGPDTAGAGTLRISMNVWPTMTRGKRQCILHWGALRFELASDGRLQVRLGEMAATLERPLVKRRWFQAELDVAADGLSLVVAPVAPCAVWTDPSRTHAPRGATALPKAGDPIFFAAMLDRWQGDVPFVADAYNGKIEVPSIRVDGRLLAQWDFSREQSGTRAFDAGPDGCHLTLVNTPMRGAAGSNWNGSVESWVRDPSQYAAIHFHDDDMTDCGWKTTLQITPPADAQSGFYIARMTAEDVQSDVPFFVSARPGKPKADVLLLAPTATYLSYANTHIKFDSHNTENLYEAPMVLSEDELYLNEHRELGLSQYDTHADESGVVYASERRPMLNTRPGLYTFNYLNDTHIVKWLEDQGVSYDVATDEDLHRYGRALLNPYRVVMTASHPEYFSTEMWDALFGYQLDGGRHMYLGGNGFYWRIAWSDDHPGVIENRRGISGVRTWEGEPGEHHLSFTGEPGGLWRTHGRAPQVLAGTGFSSTLFVRSTYFRRSEDSRDPDLSFIFEGLNSDIIGDFGFRGGGAVGLEIDRWDSDLGSPPASVILATSDHVGLGGLLSGEEYITTTRALDGVQNGRVRCDMVFFATPKGGAVWSAGTIAWATSLLWNKGENSVSRVTRNVLTRFLDPTPFPEPVAGGHARSSGPQTCSRHDSTSTSD